MLSPGGSGRGLSWSWANRCHPSELHRRCCVSGWWSCGAIGHSRRAYAISGFAEWYGQAVESELYAATGRQGASMGIDPPEHIQRLADVLVHNAAGSAGLGASLVAWAARVHRAALSLAR
ncbi:hypothetical protein BN874_420054 [Candidatus Contendobacter odensis Run_B_J11]|uniref:Uncharacterized protein n=1 Tax=Candidatus Contendobacter odensis Run_B_J11 TaxID=1400861 RepID=A0A7U7J3N3_9GAMM|nr:hypothetical protein BN874_420054 [Candidatus Contendobacter odensis Run_B_J11]